MNMGMIIEIGVHIQMIIDQNKFIKGLKYSFFPGHRECNTKFEYCQVKSDIYFDFF